MGNQSPAWQQPVPVPAPTRKGGSGWKWALGGIAILAIIGVTAAVTLSVANKGDGGPGSPTAAPPISSASTAARPDIASANDTGPVSVITEDPSCATRYPVFSAFESRAKNGWEKRDPTLAATHWTPEIRAQHEAVAEAFRDTASQIVASAKLTTHRSMRELYEQYIAYARAYADSIPTYVPIDNQLAVAAISASDAIARICNAIDYGSAAARGPLVPALPPLSEVAPVGNPADAQMMLPGPNQACAEWDSALEQFLASTAAWQQTNANIPRTEWPPEQVRIVDEAVSTMKLFNTQLSALGRKSENLILQDLANLAVKYRQAYLEAIPTYTPADSYLVNASIRIASVVAAACRAIG
ncbi:hypothetical protein [Mycolicibacterium fortuitum]|uniref:hypothetical protein n=1 Tax=Mycolicibacterium fortuitum TaxID=1766 RepID=UPI00148F51F9|nr:hypothetical protein [Mycolicibacterium fortuitum]